MLRFSDVGIRINFGLSWVGFDLHFSNITNQRLMKTFPWKYGCHIRRGIRTLSREGTFYGIRALQQTFGQRHKLKQNLGMFYLKKGFKKVLTLPPAPKCEPTHEEIAAMKKSFQPWQHRFGINIFLMFPLLIKELLALA